MQQGHLEEGLANGCPPSVTCINKIIMGKSVLPPAIKRADIKLGLQHFHLRHYKNLYIGEKSNSRKAILY